MATFMDPNISSMAYSVTYESPSAIEGRGGASIVEVNGKIIAFGGVSRLGLHYNDCYVKVSPDSAWIKEEMSGDIPTARSGHAVVAFGKFMLLFGGIDFVEEIDYNDIYILNTDNWEWKYVGESGEEVQGRNSHTLNILCSPTGLNYLVIYGGASSANGPQNDTISALLPSVKEEIDLASIFVEWKKNTCASPGYREMHTSCIINNKMYIIGGRDGDGQLLGDVWELTCEENNFSWMKRSDLSLPVSRCSHGCCTLLTEYGQTLICVYGGLTSSGNIDDKVLAIDITSDIPKWTPLSVEPVSGRFGHAMCSIYSNKGLAIFGGVNADKDFSEFVSITPKI